MREEGVLLGGVDLAIPTVFQSKLLANTNIDFVIGLMYERLGKASKAREHYKKAAAQDQPQREIARQNLEKLGDAEDSPSKAEIEQVKLNDTYSVLHVKGERDTIEEAVRRHYRDEFVGNEPLSATEYIRAKYDLEKEAVLPDNLREAMLAQKRANTLLRRIDNAYTFLFLHSLISAKEETAVATLEGQDTQTPQKTMKLASRELGEKRRLLQEIYKSGKTKEDLIEEYGCGAISETLGHASQDFSTAFKGIDNCANPGDFQAIKQLGAEDIRAAITQYNSSAAKEDRIKISDARVRKLLDVLSVPDRVYAWMAELRKEEEQATRLSSEYDAKIAVDWEANSLEMRLDAFTLKDIDFTRPRKKERGTSYISYDIETLNWVGSHNDPRGTRPEIFLAAICSESEEFDDKHLLLGADAPEETIEQIAAKYKDIVVGTQDIGTRLIDTKLTGRKARYVLVPDQIMLRRVVSDIIFYKNPSNTGGNNHDAFDLPRSMNPRRTLTANEKKMYQKILELANEPDGAFNPNPDNSGPRYVGQTWRQECRLAARNKDFLNISKNHLGILTTDSKLETIGALLDFFEGFGLEYGKVFHSYKEMELSAQRGKEGDTDEAYKNARYCYEDNIAQLRIMMFLDRIMQKAADCLQMDSAIVFGDSKAKVSRLFWDREVFDRTGMMRREDERAPYQEADIAEAKKELLAWAAKKDERQGRQVTETLTKKLATRPGLTKGCQMYMLPTLPEGLEEIVVRNHRLNKLYSRAIFSHDPIERAIRMQIIDAILMEPRIDLLRVKERRLGESEFLQKYGVDAATVRTTMKTRLEEVAERLRDFDVAAYDGNIIAVRHARDPTEIIEKYIPITGCDVLNVSEGEFVYRMRRETERGVSEIIASRGVGVPSMKKRHSQDYVFDGFQPNFLIDLEHDFVFACFEDPQKAERMVDETMQAIEDETLPPQSYFMTLKPGHDIHEYSLPYQRTKRFKVIDLTGVKKGEKRTFVCVEGEGDEIQFQEVAPGDEEALKSIMPNTEFYAKWLKDAAEKIAKLRKALKAQAKRDKETLPLF